MRELDEVDRALLALLQRDATQSYAVLGSAVGLSAGAAHDRVRKLRERGVIRATVADVDPVALGRAFTAFVMISSAGWLGDSRAALAAIPEVEEAHVVAGSASVLVKVGTADAPALQDVLRRIHRIDGVNHTESTVVLETLLERPPVSR